MNRALRVLPGSRKVTAFHRGAVAVRLGIRTPRRTSRRVTVKVRIVNLERAGPRSIAMHLRYIERDGVTADGSPARAYGAELDAVDTMRARAAEVAESWLGLRSEQEIEESLNREIEQERWTRIDRAIQAKLIEGVIDLRRRLGGHDAQVERNHMVGRLQHLRRMGLAEESSTSVWRVNPQAEPVLRAMGERGDIIRTLQRAFSRERRDFDIVGPGGPTAPIVGRIAAKGLADELNDRRYLIVDGIDGRAHYLALPSRTDELELRIGAIVEVRANDRLRPADQTIAKLADNDIYRTARHLEMAYSRPIPGRSPEAVVEAHERRLEALRRAGIVERI